MLTLLHGDNIVASRAEMLSIKSEVKDNEIRAINGKDVSEADLRQAVESLSLFGSTAFIVIENLFSPLGRKEKLIKLYADILNQASQTATILIWEPKVVGKTVLDSLKKARVLLYKTPVSIFSLLDGITADDTPNLLFLYDKALVTEPPELLLYMIQQRIRQLVQVKDGITPDRVSGWQFTRLTNQARSFTMSKLLSMHNKLIELEYSFKTGASPYTLSQLIKQFIIEL